METEKRNTTENTTPLVAIELTTEQRLYAVKGKLKENLVCRERTSKEIIQHLFDGPNEYWRGWFDMPVMDVVLFADLLAIHKANEYVDDNAVGKDLKVFSIELGGRRYPLNIEGIQQRTGEEKRARLALKAAADGEVLFFRGDYTLLRNMSDAEIAQGWRVEHGPGAAFKIRSLTEVKLNPREALEWFATTSTYTDLLPESLRAWWLSTKAGPKTTPTSGRAGEPRLSEKERVLLAFAKEKWRRTPDMSIPTIVKLFIKSDQNIMYDANRTIRRGYSQENLEKALRRLRKSAK
jgi:hypothetical protein